MGALVRVRTGRRAGTGLQLGCRVKERKINYGKNKGRNGQLGVLRDGPVVKSTAALLWI